MPDAWERKWTLPPQAEKGQSSPNHGVRAPLKAVVLSTKSVNELKPKVPNRLCRRNSPPLKDPAASSPPNKPDCQTANQLPLKVSRPWVPWASGVVNHRGGGSPTPLRSDLQASQLCLIPQCRAGKGAPGNCPPGENHALHGASKKSENIASKPAALLDSPTSSAAESPVHGHNPSMLQSGLQKPATPQLQSLCEQQATEKSLSASAAGSSKGAAKSLSRRGQKSPVCANALLLQEWPPVWPSECVAPSGLCTEKKESLDCQGRQTGLATATLQDPTASVLGVSAPRPKVSIWGHSKRPLGLDQCATADPDALPP